MSQAKVSKATLSVQVQKVLLGHFLQVADKTDRRNCADCFDESVFIVLALSNYYFDFTQRFRKWQFQIFQSLHLMKSFSLVPWDGFLIVHEFQRLVFFHSAQTSQHVISITACPISLMSFFILNCKNWQLVRLEVSHFDHCTFSEQILSFYLELKSQVSLNIGLDFSNQFLNRKPQKMTTSIRLQKI